MVKTKVNRYNCQNGRMVKVHRPVCVVLRTARGIVALRRVDILAAVAG